MRAPSVTSVPARARARDPCRLAREELRREVPERRDEPGLDQLDLPEEVRLARGDLLRLRVAVPGGRHLRTFATKTSARVRPMPSSSRSSSFPPGQRTARPAGPRGTRAPSPTNTRSASGLPEPKTTWVRPAESAHFVHEAVCSAYFRSAAARSTASIGGQLRRAPDASLLGAGARPRRAPRHVHPREAADESRCPDDGPRGPLPAEPSSSPIPSESASAETARSTAPTATTTQAASFRSPGWMVPGACAEPSGRNRRSRRRSAAGAG